MDENAQAPSDLFRAQEDPANGSKDGEEEVEKYLYGIHQKTVVGHVGHNDQKRIDGGDQSKIDRGVGDDLLEGGFDIHRFMLILSVVFSNNIPYILEKIKFFL